MKIKNSKFKLGYYISLITSVLAFITLGIAITTPPLSGPFCNTTCFQYPYLDILNRFPRDYYWIYSAQILVIFYLIMNICVHQVVATEKKHFSLISVVFASMATLVLFVNYFIQVSVIQQSLLAGETDGIALLSQYNPHGIFITLEEIGFLFMNISFFFYVLIFSGTSYNEKAIKWTSIIGFFLTIISFIIISLNYGINREYRFEVIIISITWIELIVLGLLLPKYFKNVEG